MFDDLSTEIPAVVVAVAGGVGAVVAAVISGIFSIVKDVISHKREKGFKDAETKLADARLDADRNHQLRMMQTQFAAQRAEEVERLGRKVASELLGYVGDIEQTWKLDASWKLLEVDKATASRAKQATFRLPDASVAEYVFNGVQLLEHAWIGARSGAVEDPEYFQRRDLRRLQHVLSSFIAGQPLKDEWAKEQQSDMQCVDDTWREYFERQD